MASWSGLGLCHLRDRQWLRGMQYMGQEWHLYTAFAHGFTSYIVFFLIIWYYMIQKGLRMVLRFVPSLTALVRSPIKAQCYVPLISTMHWRLFLIPLMNIHIFIFISMIDTLKSDWWTDKNARTSIKHIRIYKWKHLKWKKKIPFCLAIVRINEKLRYSFTTDVL